MKSGNYIYVYDTDSHKVIIIDGETGEELDKKNDQVSSILGYLRDREAYADLRKFAVWCAHQINDEFKPLQTKMIDLAEKAISGEINPDELNKTYDKSEGQAVATDTVGLRQGSQNAPAFLATRETINPNAYEGAQQAARFHRLWAEMKNKRAQEEEEDNNHKEVLKEIKINTGDEYARKVEQEQIDYLLDLIGEKTGAGG